MLPNDNDKYRPIKKELAAIIGEQLSQVGIKPLRPTVYMHWPSKACYSFQVSSDLKFGQLADVIDSAFCEDARLSSLIKAPDNEYIATLTVDVVAVLAIEAA